MIKLILTRFWPVLIPLIVYLAWLFYVRRKRREAAEKPSFGDGPFMLTVWSTAGLLVLSLFSYFLLVENSPGEYTPSRFEKGQFIRGTVEKK